MDRQAFDAVRTQVMKAGHTSSSRELDGMIMDVDYRLEQAGFRVVGRIMKTGDPRCMLEATCTLDTVSAADARSVLDRTWVDHIAFDGKVHTIAEDPNQVLLDFVTWRQPPSGGHVTGRIVVDLRRPPRRSPKGGDGIIP